MDKLYQEQEERNRLDFEQIQKDNNDYEEKKKENIINIFNSHSRYKDLRLKNIEDKSYKELLQIIASYKNKGLLNKDNKEDIYLIIHLGMSTLNN